MGCPTQVSLRRNEVTSDRKSQNEKSQINYCFCNGGTAAGCAGGGQRRMDWSIGRSLGAAGQRSVREPHRIRPASREDAFAFPIRAADLTTDRQISAWCEATAWGERAGQCTRQRRAAGGADHHGQGHHSAPSETDESR